MAGLYAQRSSTRQDEAMAPYSRLSVVVIDVPDSGQLARTPAGTAWRATGAAGRLTDDNSHRWD